MADEKNIINELMRDYDITEEDLLELLEKDNKEKKHTCKKKEVPDVIYIGTVHYTCETCNSTFERPFNTNKPDYTIKRKAYTCFNCEDVFKHNHNQEEAINILLTRLRSTVIGSKVC